MHQDTYSSEDGAEWREEEVSQNPLGLGVRKGGSGMRELQAVWAGARLPGLSARPC